MDQDDAEDIEIDMDGFFRLPGLYRRWEIAQVLEAGKDYHLEDAGTTSEGGQLYAVFRREEEPAGEEAATVANCRRQRRAP
jgi:hypothetical protein